MTGVLYKKREDDMKTHTQETGHKAMEAEIEETQLQTKECQASMAAISSSEEGRKDSTQRLRGTWFCQHRDLDF